MITSDRQIKEYNLNHFIVPEEVPEDDDEIMRTIPKAGEAGKNPKAAAGATGGAAKPAGKPAAAAAAPKGGANKQAAKK